MKKSIFVSLLALVLCFGCLLGACAPAEEEVDLSNVTVRVAAMTGPTGIGLVSLMDKAEKSETALKYNFNLYASAQEIVPLLVKGEVDIAAVPANLAAIQFNKNDGFINVLAINNLGVLSVLEKGDTIKTVADLKGKVIYAPVSGKGAVPEYALNYILTAAGLNPATDVTVEWKSEVTEILAALKTGAGSIALLPQPAATNALGAVEGLREALNVNDCWNALGGDSKLVTGVIVARREFVEQNPAAVAKFLEEYKASAEFVNADIKSAAALVEKYGISKAAVAEKSIPKCNITYISGEEMKTVLSAYLKTLFDANPASVGGALPADNFYYVEK